MSFIVAQDPMEHTVNEFWWMIAEHNVTTMVMLAELGDGQSKCYCYWPSEEFDCDYVKVKLIEEEMTQFYTKRVFNVTTKKVRIIVCTIKFKLMLLFQNGTDKQNSRSKSVSISNMEKWCSTRINLIINKADRCCPSEQFDIHLPITGPL